MLLVEGMVLSPKRIRFDLAVCECNNVGEMEPMRSGITTENGSHKIVSFFHSPKEILANNAVFGQFAVMNLMLLGHFGCFVLIFWFWVLLDPASSEASFEL